MKILITGGTSATALKLSKAFVGHQVILADYGDVPAFNSPSFTLISLGDKNDDTLAHTLLNNCLDHEIDAILPLQHYEIEPITKAEVLFDEFNVKILLPKRDILAAYFTSNHVLKADEYVVFLSGEIIFTTIDAAFLTLQGRGESLNGAFYYSNETLHLITI